MENKNFAILSYLNKYKKNSFGFFPSEAYDSLLKLFLKNNVSLNEIEPGKDEAVDFFLFNLAFGKSKKLEEQIENLRPFLSYLNSWDDTDTLLKYVHKPQDIMIVKKISQELIMNDNPYVRRLGYELFMKTDLSAEINAKAAETSFKDETSYTLQMSIGWVISDIVIHNFKEGYSYIASSPLSYSILSKGISKSLDSYRVSSQNKDKLRKLRARLLRRKEQH
jgi:hypothetical protein